MRKVLLLAGVCGALWCASDAFAAQVAESTFLALDRDQDGVIDRTEARRSAILANYFDDADTNADDVIDLREFAVFEAGGGGGGSYGGSTPSASRGVPAPGQGEGSAAETGPARSNSGSSDGGIPAGTPPPTSSGSSKMGSDAPAGTPPPTSSGPAGRSAPAGTPPPTSSGGISP